MLLHIGLGFLTKEEPVTASFYYFAATFYALVEIAATRDKGGIAAYYGVYLGSIEILHRMAKTALFWEFGKYSCMAVFTLASIIGTPKRQRPFLLLAYFMLLVPGILVAAIYGGADEARMRDLASQYISGPAALLAAGWYFYQRTIKVKHLKYLLSIALLPSIAVLTLLFLGKSLAEIDFIGGSNFEASGGFGPNQVSSALGWGIVLILLSMLFKITVTGHRMLDICLLLLLVLRGLLTFSRGGMMGAFGSIGLSMLAVAFLSLQYRRRLWRATPSILAGLGLILAVTFVANHLTGNFLLFRYQGKSTSEVILGQTVYEKEYLSGRGSILESEINAFRSHPVFGVGIGRGTILREYTHGSEFVASHTEFSRMLGEHGILGLFAFFCAFIWLPYRYFRTLTHDFTRLWMAVFYLLAMFTLAHSGMRLALPSVAFGLAFLIILPELPGQSKPPP